MQILKSHMFRKLAIIQIIAVVVGVTAALISVNAATLAVTPVGAANHCTNFFPYNWNQDTNCNTASSIGQGYQTSTINKHYNGNLEYRADNIGYISMGFGTKWYN